MLPTLASRGCLPCHISVPLRTYKIKTDMIIHRIVPNIYSNDLDKSKRFYTEFLEMETVMDMQWILTFASKDNPTAQITVLRYDKKDILNNADTFLSIEVSDVDDLYEKAKKMNLEIVYPLTDETWGVRRFFVQEPNGATINLMMHE
ncbi:MAG TPA: VOC family protein [Bacteroidia bacterium]|nr:VOC family protein [Bacteroidia bacterium]